MFLSRHEEPIPISPPPPLPPPLVLSLSKRNKIRTIFPGRENFSFVLPQQAFARVAGKQRRWVTVRKIFFHENFTHAHVQEGEIIGRDKFDSAKNRKIGDKACCKPPLAYDDFVVGNN